VKTIAFLTTPNPSFVRRGALLSYPEQNKLLERAAEYDQQMRRRASQLRATSEKLAPGQSRGINYRGSQN